jgi:hypothetical protein
MFLATFTIALALLVWRSGTTISELQKERAESTAQLSADKLNCNRLEGQRQYHQASADRYSLIEATGKQAEFEFRKVQERYSEIVPINEQTVSLRNVPMLTEPGTGVRINRTRIYVPSKRDVYLILGVVRSDRIQGSSGPPDQPRYIDSFSVANAGPFQLVLNSGSHDVDWVISPKQADKIVTFKVFVNEQLLSTSSWMHDNYDMVMHSSSSEQKDFSFTEPLPQLVKASVPTDSIDESFEQDAFQSYLQLSISDKSSSYPPFPQIQVGKTDP